MNIDNISDTYDPAIAEKFQILEQLEAPDLPAADTLKRGQTRPYTRYLMVASVAIIGLACAGAVYVGASSSGELDQNVASSDVEVATTEIASEVGSYAASEGSVSPSDKGLVVDTNDDEALPEPIPTPETELTPIDPPTIPIPAPAQPAPAEITPSGPRLVVSGVVTKVIKDCGPGLMLNDIGEVVQTEVADLCELGAFITVGQTRIQTTSSPTADGGPNYDKHMANLKPGANVSVVTMKDTRGDLTLDCDECGIAVAIHG